MIAVLHIVGARPNFVKLWSVRTAMERRPGVFRQAVVHTGQHSGAAMCGDILRDLGLPEPDVRLGCADGAPQARLSAMARQLYGLLSDGWPDAVLLYGDVDSTLAGAMAVLRAGVRAAHVEAGLRSFDWTMPEEYNRVFADSVSDWLFTSEPSADENLAGFQDSASRVCRVGSTMVDTLLAKLPDALAASGSEAESGDYAVLTLHRPANVDEPGVLAGLLRAVASSVGGRMPIVFPAHPRTVRVLHSAGLLPECRGTNMRVVEPLPYLRMIALLGRARLVLTDSGGVQEETTALRVPCLTLRDNTERPITVSVGSNRLAGTSGRTIASAVESVMLEPPRLGSVPEFWDGRAGERVAARLEEDLA